jgi:hypothetical protein
VDIQPTGWMSVDVQLPNDATTYTDVGILIRVNKDGPTAGTWSGTFYIDDVQLQP